jgi:hypothetical protein
MNSSGDTTKCVARRDRERTGKKAVLEAQHEVSD